MTSLLKDGRPVVPVCVECAHHEGGMDFCLSPKRETTFDPVVGYQWKATRCRDARKDSDKCGTLGAWYEKAEPKKKPNWYQRFNNWFFN